LILKRIHSILLLSFICQFAFGQLPLSNLRIEKVALQDTIHFENPNYINGTFHPIYPTDSVFWTSFILDEEQALLVKRTDALPFDSVQYSYRIIPDFILQDIQDRDRSEIVPFFDESKWLKSTSARNKKQIGGSRLNKSGSISRTVLGGSIQDVSIQSEMNLQLSGEIGKDTYIKASINDNNLPSQQEGYSQKLREFDQIFVEVSHKNHSLRAGDIRYKSDKFSLFRVNKKAAGLIYSYTSDSSTFRFGGGISRGKFRNQPLDLQEGNNGPYRLKGTNGEAWISVISGSDRVYLNGKLLKRGLQQDYTINYNTAEISFTNKHLISPQMRVFVEFEYTELSYNRSLYFADASIQRDNWDLDISYFSEQDIKLQPVQQQLSAEERILLRDSGDTQVLGMTAVEQTYKENSLLYRRIDSLGYSDIYEFSVDTTVTLYSVNFADVGEGNGHYIQDSELSALGNVYRWVAPLNGQKQGRYEAVKVLIAPKQLKNLQVKWNKKWGKGFRTQLELGYSQEDKNLFSTKDDDDNDGLAIILNQMWEKQFGKRKLAIAWKNSYIPSKYKSPYLLRDSEFQRSWNLGNEELDQKDEYWTGLGIQVAQDSLWSLKLNTDYIQKGSNYSGWRNQLEVDRNGQFLDWNMFSFWLNNKALNEEGDFYRLRQNLSYQKKNWKHGFEMNIEHNKLKNTQDKLLSSKAFSFDEWKGFTSFSDDSSKWIGLDINYRNDRKVDSLAFSDYSSSIQTDLTAKFVEKWGMLTTGLKFKNIHYLVDTLDQDEQILISYIGYQHSWSKRRIRLNSRYENGKGQEARLRISYVQVPDGQGNYVWVDYNENNIKEPDEFEQAVFSDQANYIRLLSPENEYISVFKHALKLNMDFDLGELLAFRDSWKGLKFAWNMDQSNTLKSLDWDGSWNPFKDYDVEYISQQRTLSRLTVKNIFPNSRVRLQSSYKQNIDTRLISFGLEENKNNYWKSSLMIPLKGKSSLSSELKIGKKERVSENYSDRNLDLKILDFEQSWKQKIGSSLSVKSGVHYTGKDNSSLLKETLTSLSFFFEGELTAGEDQLLFSKLTYLNNSYNAEEGTAISYEMLEGLKKGNNLVWEFNWRKRLSKSLELNIVYQGRKSETIRAVHTGQVQLRALF